VEEDKSQESRLAEKKPNARDTKLLFHLLMAYIGGLMSDYRTFLKTKTLRAQPHGIKTKGLKLNAKLYEFQRVCVDWALRRGRAALFQDCGLGKTPQQLEWARVIAEKTGKPVLILAPLAVAQQTVREGEKFGIPVRHARDGSEVQAGINVTNYEMLQHFTADGLGGIVLDESSILKAFAGKVRRSITDFAAKVHYRLACTATPSPNDFMELGTHSEFVSAMPRPEMLSTFFVHDSSGGTDKWRLKGHGAAPFWRWVAQWAIACRTPSDLGQGARSQVRGRRWVPVRNGGSRPSGATGRAPRQHG
jgi:hypothetical protein